MERHKNGKTTERLPLVSRLRADIEEQLRPFATAIDGDVLASLMVIKARPSAAEVEGGPPFSGKDGAALDAAFEHLGWGGLTGEVRPWLGLLLPPKIEDGSLRAICETVDPLAIVTLDEGARLALIAAFETVEEQLAIDFVAGGQAQALGRLLVSVEDFEDSLSDEEAKQKAWAQLRRCAFPPWGQR
jgi:hypothetical protein